MALAYVSGRCCRPGPPRTVNSCPPAPFPGTAKWQREGRATQGAGARRYLLRITGKAAGFRHSRVDETVAHRPPYLR